jgi:hypothetical protein
MSVNNCIFGNEVNGMKVGDGNVYVCRYTVDAGWNVLCHVPSGEVRP